MWNEPVDNLRPCNRRRSFRRGRSDHRSVWHRRFQFRPEVGTSTCTPSRTGRTGPETRVCRNAYGHGRSHLGVLAVSKTISSNFGNYLNMSSGIKYKQYIFLVLGLGLGNMAIIVKYSPRDRLSADIWKVLYVSQYLRLLWVKFLLHDITGKFLKR